MQTVFGYKTLPVGEHTQQGLYLVNRSKFTSGVYSKKDIDNNPIQKTLFYSINYSC